MFKGTITLTYLNLKAYSISIKSQKHSLGINMEKIKYPKNLNNCVIKHELKGDMSDRLIRYLLAIY